MYIATKFFATARDQILIGVNYISVYLINCEIEPPYLSAFTLSYLSLDTKTSSKDIAVRKYSKHCEKNHDFDNIQGSLLQAFLVNSLLHKQRVWICGPKYETRCPYCDIRHL